MVKKLACNYIISEFTIPVKMLYFKNVKNVGLEIRLEKGLENPKNQIKKHQNNKGSTSQICMVKPFVFNDSDENRTRVTAVKGR